MIVSDPIITTHKKLGILEFFTFGLCNGETKHVKTILAIHGNGCTGNWFRMFDQFARREKVCLVAPTIPGWGLSLAKHPLTPKEFSTVIHQLMLEHLKIEEFSVIGVSMGGPYAAAVAALLSQHVLNVNLFLSFGKKAPDNDPFKSLTLIQRLGLLILQNPTTTDFLVDWIILPSIKNSPTLALEQMYPHEFISIKGTPQAEILLQEMTRSIQWTRVGMKENSMILLDGEWGFELEEISHVKGRVTITMAQNDTMVFENNPKYFARRIPSSELVVLPNTTHLAATLALEKMFTQLLK